MRFKKALGKIAKNKKGFDPDFTDVVMSIIIAGVTFFFVFLYMAFTSNDIEKIALAKIGEVEDNYILLSYLRSPMEKTGITVSEYFGIFSREDLKQKISKYYKEYCLEDSELTEETREIFKDIKDWMLTIITIEKLSGEERICHIKSGDTNEMPIAAVVPSNDNTINVGLRFRHKD